MEEKKLLALSLQICGVIQSLAVAKIIKKKKSEKKKLWSRKWLLERDSGRGMSSLMFKEIKLEDPESFKNFTRMQIKTFEKLLCLIKFHIQKKNTNMREAIDAKSRLLITLRYLATGDSFKSLSYTFRVCSSAIGKIVLETVRVIYAVLRKEYLKCPNSKSDWLRIAEEFESQWDFPFCLGAIDGKHIAIQASKADGSFYYNYKGFNSIILFALVDANCQFLYIDVGCNGRVHDASVFHDTALYKKTVLSNTLDLPSSGELARTNDVVPYVFLGDEAFPLSTRLMKPIKQASSEEEKIFNYRLSRARRTVENAFGILANRFRVLQRTNNLKVKKVENVVRACCVLHNFVYRIERDVFGEEYRELTSQHKENNLTQLQPNSANRSRDEAVAIREKLLHYFSTVGAVSWQWNAVKNFNF